MENILNRTTHAKLSLLNHNINTERLLNLLIFIKLNGFAGTFRGSPEYYNDVQSTLSIFSLVLLRTQKGSAS